LISAEDLAHGPGLAQVLAVEGAEDRGNVGRNMLLIILGNHPNGHQQCAIQQGNAVAGAKGKGIAEMGHGVGCDIDRLAPGKAVIIAVTAKYAATLGRIVLAVQEVDPAVLILHHDRIVDSLMLLSATGQGHLLAEGKAVVFGPLEQNIH